MYQQNLLIPRLVLTLAIRRVKHVKHSTLSGVHVDQPLIFYAVMCYYYMILIIFCCLLCYCLFVFNIWVRLSLWFLSPLFYFLCFPIGPTTATIIVSHEVKSFNKDKQLNKSKGTKVKSLISVINLKLSSFCFFFFLLH